MKCGSFLFSCSNTSICWFRFPLFFHLFPNPVCGHNKGLILLSLWSPVVTKIFLASALGSATPTARRFLGFCLRSGALVLSAAELEKANKKRPWSLLRSAKSMDCTWRTCYVEAAAPTKLVLLGYKVGISRGTQRTPKNGLGTPAARRLLGLCLLALSRFPQRTASVTIKLIICNPSINIATMCRPLTTAALWQ